MRRDDRSDGRAELCRGSGRVVASHSGGFTQVAPPRIFGQLDGEARDNDDVAAVVG